MRPTLQIEATGFHAMVSELSRLSGKDYGHVLFFQVGAVLNNCIKHTPVADTSEGAIIKRASRHNNHIEFASGEVISFWKKVDAVMFLDDSTFKPHKGEAPPRLIGGKSWHLMAGAGGGYRWSNARWAKWKRLDSLKAGTAKENLAAARRAKGLTAQSWVQIADDLGVAVKAPGYVRNARPSNGRFYKNGVAIKFSDATAFYVEIRNDNPIMTHLRHPSGAEILQRAVSSRLKAFEYEVGHDVFSDIKTRAQRYPGIFTD